MPAPSPLAPNALPEEPLDAYDTYVSLGENCEAGLQFARIGYEESGFFRFTYSPFHSTYRLIAADFAGVYEKDNLVPVGENIPMVRDAEYDIVFHSRLPQRQDPDTLEVQLRRGREFDEIHAEECSKLRHFIGKWNALTASDRRTLYLIKLTEGDGRACARRLLELFERKYPAHRYTLLFLQTEDRREGSWGLPHVAARYFPRFAPYTNAHDADLGAWDRLFQEFPLRTPVLA